MNLEQLHQGEVFFLSVSISIYPIVYNVDGLEKGVYKYVPSYNSLKLVNKLSEDQSLSDLGEFGDIDPQKINVAILFVYELYANSRKYGDSGMAFAFIEAG